MGDKYGQLIYLMLLLVAVGGWVLVEYRQRLGQALRTAMAWGLIFVGAMAGYGLWNDLKTEIAPRQMVTETGAVEIPRAGDGHYYAVLEVNGVKLRFMADTGATNVVLSQADARALGIDPGSLSYLGEAMTANGVVRTARVHLPDVVFGPFRDADVVAYVNEGEMDMSLLGMDYLGSFAIGIAGGKMVLRR